MRSVPVLLAIFLLATPVAQAAEPAQAIGGHVESLLEFARSRHPEFAALRAEAEAAAARVEPAGALPDPVLRTELRNVTNTGSDASVGWMDLATRIKLNYAQHHVHMASIRNAHQNLDLMQRVAEIACVRYASGLGSQQDALRAQEREADLTLEAERLRRQANLNQSLSELSESLAAMEVARRLEALVGTGLLPQAELNLNAALAGSENGRAACSRRSRTMPRTLSR